MYKSDQEYLINYIRNGRADIYHLQGSTFSPTRLIRIQFEKVPSVHAAWDALEDIFYLAESSVNENRVREIDYEVLGYPRDFGGLPFWDMLIECPRAEPKFARAIGHAVRQDKRIKSSSQYSLAGEGWDDYSKATHNEMEAASRSRSLFTISSGWF